MPNICFSYTSDVPPGIKNRGAATGLPQRPAGKPYSCFSYSADVRRMPVWACFSYPAGLRRMPVFACFSYPADLPPGVRNRNAAP